MALGIRKASRLKQLSRQVGVLLTVLVLVLSTVPVNLMAAEGESGDEAFWALNDVNFYGQDAAPCSDSLNPTSGATPGGEANFEKPGAISLKGANNAEKVMNFLLEQGFPLAAASGMMGNFSVESNFSPTAENPKSGAYGLAQWLGSRKTALISYGGVNYKTLEIQLQFLMHELQTTEKASMVVKNETDPVQAAITWELKFERSGEVAVSQRSSRALKIFEEWTANKSLSAAFLSSIGSGSGSSTPSTGDTTLANGSCPAGGSGSTVFGAGELVGYAFPIAVSKKSDINTFGGALNKLPCTGICHHDGTYALDLGVTGYGARDSKFNPNSIGAPVYAISDGKIVKRRDNPNATRTNCTQFSLLSSKDDHTWWFGHLALPGAAVSQGQTVKAGQLLGYVGPSNCADNTAPHLHIDSGYGIPERRNELVSQVVNGLFNQIKE